MMQTTRCSSSLSSCKPLLSKVQSFTTNFEMFVIRVPEKVIYQEMMAMLMRANLTSKHFLIDEVLTVESK
jgi:hypothetical protein